MARSDKQRSRRRELLKRKEKYGTVVKSRILKRGAIKIVPVEEKESFIGKLSKVFKHGKKQDRSGASQSNTKRSSVVRQRPVHDSE